MKGAMLMSIYDLSSIGICIDEYNAGEMKGRIFSSLHSEPETFNSVITLVKTIDKIFDEGEYPQATMRCRGFGKRASVTEKKAAEENRDISDPTKLCPVMSNARGKKATFGVRVMFRQNASWQGTLCWLEKNREENFRSVLEMMMLIDSAFEAETAAATDSSENAKVVNR